MAKKIVWIFNTIVILIFVIVIADFFGLLGSNKDVAITINEGDGISVVASKLQKEGVILQKDVFTAFCKIGVGDVEIHPGTFYVNSKMTYKQLSEAFKEPVTSQIIVTIPEGFEPREISDRLFSNEVIKSEDEFNSKLKSYKLILDDGTEIDGSKNSLSGFLFPDTYYFNKNANPDDVIKLMTNNFKAHWIDEYTKKAKEHNMSVDEIIILASIIEREANNAEDFKLVSAVFHNRLKTGMKLQSCATVQYILKERKPVLSIADTKINSPYNTYINEGLPPTAIASPGLLAIEAALYPDDSDYLFFFTDKNGVTHFSHTNDEHNALINQYGL